MITVLCSWLTGIEGKLGREKPDKLASSQVGKSMALGAGDDTGRICGGKVTATKHGRLLGNRRWEKGNGPFVANASYRDL